MICAHHKNYIAGWQAGADGSSVVDGLHKITRHEGLLLLWPYIVAMLAVALYSGYNAASCMGATNGWHLLLAGRCSMGCTR